jgi:crotonobetaine/carnitine-CoA ligase
MKSQSGYGIMEYTTKYDDRPAKYQTISSVLENRAEVLGDSPFMYYGHDGSEMSFSEVNEAANTVANSLLERGLNPQQKVSVMVRNPYETAVMMFGINKAGGVYAPINFEYKGSALSYQLNDTDPEVLFIEDQYVERLNAIQDDLESEFEVVVYETDAESEPLEGSFASARYRALRDGSTSNPDVEISWADEVSIVYTSGTTGMPKGVVIPYRWIFSNYTTYPILNNDDLVHNHLPWYHIGAVYFLAVSALTAGAEMAIWDRFSPNDFWDRIEQYQASTTVLVSVMMSWLMDQPERDNDHHNPLNKVLVLPLPDYYDDLAQRFGLDFVSVGFGQTESGFPLWGLINAAQGEHATPDSIRRGMTPDELIPTVRNHGWTVVDELPGDRYLGRPRSGVMEVTVLDDEDEELPPGEVGELAVRPKQPGVLMKEYYGKPERTVEAFSNLWFHTGDAVYRDEEDNYFFVDRIGDVIRRRGENISSIQIQEVIGEVDQVEQNAVFPVPAPEGGEDEIAAAILLAEDETLSEDELLAYLEDGLPEFMVPRYIYYVDDIPTTQTGKMQKYKLEERLFN